MDYTGFQKAKETFQLERVICERQPLYKDLHRFLKRFPSKSISHMKIDDYVYGKGKKTFCYYIEKTLANYGSISTRLGYMKYGVWWAKEEGIYKFDPSFGDNYEEAFKFVKKALVELLKDGEFNHYVGIALSPLYSLFAGKVLSLYYPEKYLNIFSSKHLDHYLISLDLDTPELMSKHSIFKRKRLLEFKNSDPDMKSWSVDAFAVFLWDHFPKDPRFHLGGAVKPKEKPLSFSCITKIKFVDLELTDDTNRTKVKQEPAIKKSPDYEAEAARARLLGDRGEHIVMVAEVERLMTELGISKKKASELVMRVSRDSDSYGYDILSLNPDGTNRYIEVKATQAKVGDMTFYYTSHELETARKYGNAYYLYVVYEVTSRMPKIWVRQNPFINNELELEPIKYRVNLKAQKRSKP